MASKNPIITIKIDKHHLGVEDLENLRRWENEGGRPTQNDAMLSSVPLPLRPGEVFEVLRAEMRDVDSDLICEVELNLLSPR